MSVSSLAESSPVHRVASRVSLIVAFVLAWGGGATTRAAADETGASRVPARVVAGKLVVACDLSTRFRRVPVNLYVELEAPCGLRLHNRAARGIRAENRDGSPNPITIHLPGRDIRVPRREHGPEKDYEDFTKYHSADLGEVALVGTIGAEILKKYHLTFDLHAGFLTLAPPEPEREDAGEEIEGTTTVPITLTNDMIWLPVRYEDGRPAALALGTFRYDTVVDRDVCDERGRPAGDIGALRLGEIDLAAYVAFRPEEVVQVHADGVAGVAGLNVLKHFKVDIDRVNRVARFEQTVPPTFPEADLAFFRARAEEDGDTMQAYLESYPQERLSREAAALLVDLRLDEKADAETCKLAFQWVNDVQLEDLRATAMLDLMKKLSDAGQPRHVIAAGEIGLPSGRKDRYPDAVHKIHTKLGAVLLDFGQGKAAWKHLLSAAFGMPEDGLTNLHLARFYEQEKRYKRAYSRYVQAMIQPESGPQALAGLERVQAHMPGGERFSVDLVERLIGGKVLSFGSATRYKPEPEKDTKRVVLVEFFTNAHLLPAIGGALGNEGLLSHFSREHVAALSYHMATPELEPLVNEFSERTVREGNILGPRVHRISGTRFGPGAARADQKEQVYNMLRRIVLEELAKKPVYTLGMDASVEGEVVSGRLEVAGPGGAGVEVHLVLAERGVLFPGKSKVVIHRMVARDAILGGARGVPFTPKDGVMKIEFSSDLAKLRAKNEAFLDALQARGVGTVQKISTRIDPHQVTLVAYVRDRATRTVYQALQVDPAVVGDEAK